jgi:hypothetical protein
MYGDEHHSIELEHEASTPLATRGPTLLFERPRK